MDEDDAPQNRYSQSGSAELNGQPVGASGNRAPTISGTPALQTVTNRTYVFRPQADDVDGDQLWFSIRNKPEWASFDVNTGTLSGTPSGKTSSYGISITVSDGHVGSTLPAFNFIVSVAGSSPADPDSAPPTYALADEMYFFQPDVVDTNGAALTFDITNKPPWLSFDSSFGTLSGLPGHADIGVYSNISISASDGTSTSRLGPFSIEVLSAGTRSVTLAWAPPTENDDGSAITDLAGYRIRYGTELGAYPNAIELNNPGLTTTQIDGLYQEALYFVISAYNSLGSESNFSNAVLVTLR